MSTSSRPPVIDLTSLARVDAGNRVSAMAAGLTGSEILKIAGEIRALTSAGAKICNLTVGDFAPKQFPIPETLRLEIGKALERGETNYPPSDGIPELRQAVKRYYERALGLSYPTESILIAGGARPVIYGIFRAIAWCIRCRRGTTTITCTSWAPSACRSPVRRKTASSPRLPTWPRRSGARGCSA